MPMLQEKMQEATLPAALHMLDDLINEEYLFGTSEEVGERGEEDIQKPTWFIHYQEQDYQLGCL